MHILFMFFSVLYNSENRDRIETNKDNNCTVLKLEDILKKMDDG